MKKILFSAYSLDIGGIETSLITLLNYLAKTNFYDIVLVLEKKEGIFFKELDDKIKVLEYSPSKNKNVFFRKIFNLFKRIKFYLKNHNKYDFSASFATYSMAGSFVARCASKNNALWVHTNYIKFYKDIENAIKFFKSIESEKFKKIVCVSNDTEQAIKKCKLEQLKKVIVCNNLIDNIKIEKMSNEKIDIKNNGICTFVYVGRLSEEEKKISRIIEAGKRLKLEGQKFRIVLVGDGKDIENYKKMVKQSNLKNDIIFVGKKGNPYPYIKQSNYVLLTSDYEGWPTIYMEALVLNKPMLTTNVSDAEELISNKYGIIMQNNIEDICNVMKKAINNEYQFNEKFNSNEYNEKIKKQLKKIIEEV